MATATTDKAATSQIKLIPLISISPNPNNRRNLGDKDPTLPGLAQSIAGVGLLNPITVREVDHGAYMILAGERRWRAARMLPGLKQVECRVVDVTDEMAKEIITIENLQREDLHWLEQARDVEDLVKSGKDVSEIARDIGKSESWVHLRAKLAKISPKWKAAVEEPKGDYANWSPSMLELIARFPIATQEALLKERNWELKDCATAAELDQYLSTEFLRQLKSAPWDIADAKLVPKAGACSSCPKRSSCQQQLFAESKDDNCLDSACWKSKTDAHVLAQVAIVRKAHPKAILLKDTDGYSQDLPKKLEDAEADWNYTAAKEGAKDAIPAIYVCGDKVGKMVYVKPNGPGGAGRKGTADKDEKPAVVTVEDRLAQFLKRRDKVMIGRVIGKLGAKEDATSINHWDGGMGPKDCTDDVKRPARAVLIACAICLGIEGSHSSFDDDVWGHVDATADDGMELDDHLWNAVRSALISRLIADKEHSQDVTGARYVASVCGIDWKAIAKQAQDGNPLPKSLAEHFGEDGSPRNGLVAKGKGTKGAAAKGRA